MKIAAVQFAPEFGLPEFNLDRALDLAKHEDADLFVLPELMTSGYQFLDRDEVRRYAEEIPHGPTTERLQQFATTMDAHVIGCFPESSQDSAGGERLFISAVLVGPEGVVGVYRKMHLFRDEKDLFDPGDTGFEVFDIGEAQVGMLICFDWIFPEAARALALKGADLIAVPANLVLPWCQRAMGIRSIENRLFSVVANRWGEEARAPGDPLVFTGNSQVIGPDGAVLDRLGDAENGVVRAEVDILTARDKRVTERNDVFGDRRPAFYRALTA